MFMFSSCSNITMVRKVRIFVFATFLKRSWHLNNTNLSDNFE